MGCGLVLILLMTHRECRVRLSQSLSALAEPRKRMLIGATLGLCTLGVLIPPLLRHATFQTGLFDLGQHANVVWHFSRGDGFYDSLQGRSYLSLHWQPVIALYSPVLMLWKDPTALLLVQSTLLALGGGGLYRLAHSLTGARGWSLCLALTYFSSPQLHGINRYDFHPECIVVPAVIWGACWLGSGRRVRAALCFTSLWFVKEDMTFVALALGLYGMMAWRPHRRLGAVIAGSSVLASVALVLYVIPKLRGTDAHPLLVRYNDFGDSPSEIARTLLTHPLHVFDKVLAYAPSWRALYRMLYVHLGLPLLSGWLMITPLVGWVPHALTHLPAQKALVAHYAVGVWPLFCLCAAHGLSKVLLAPRGWGARIRHAMEWVTVPAMMAWVGALGAFNVGPYFAPLEETHRRALANAVSKIPDGAAVSAQLHVGARVALRENLALFPDVSGAEWIVVDRKGIPFPFESPESLNAKIDRLLDSEVFRVTYDQDGVLVFSRRPEERTGRPPEPPR